MPPQRQVLEAARQLIAGWSSRTPLVPLRGAGAVTVYLKLESLQPGGSFKIRGAAYAVASMTKRELDAGPWTASTGNMAIALGLVCQRAAVRSTAVVPTTASASKLDTLSGLGMRLIHVPPAQWVEINEAGTYPGLDGPYLHPAHDERLIVANATIAAEILEDLPTVDTILTPWGSGGLTCGVALGVQSLGAAPRVFAAEREGRAPLGASLAAGSPQCLAGPKPTFPDAIGARTVLPTLWECARKSVAGAMSVEASKIADAVRILAGENGLVVEGAGATPVAVAIERSAELGTVVCVVSGGNIDSSQMEMILAGRVPV